MITKIHFPVPFNISFHFFICWFNSLLSLSSKGHETEKSFLILNTDYLGPLFSVLIPLHVWNAPRRFIPESDTQVRLRSPWVLGLTLRNGRIMIADAPRAGVVQDAVTGLPWKSVLRGACRRDNHWDTTVLEEVSRRCPRVLAPWWRLLSNWKVLY